MEQSKVYFTDFRSRNGENMPHKMIRLIRAAGMERLDFENKFVAIKIHFGEPGNLAYLRPNYAKALAEEIKRLGGKPFLTDCNTLYVGRRKDGLEHIEAAYENGYSPFQTGCQVIIADGIKGTDEVYVPVKNGEYVQEAKIGHALMDADIILSLSHFKGHQATGFGGTLKNIGMGGGSRAGKMEMHSAGKPKIDEKACIGCQRCAQNCAQDAVYFERKKARIDYDKCVGCGRCIAICPKDAVCAAMDESNDILNYKIAEYTQAILQDRPHFHINIAQDISPLCDCAGFNDAPIVPDVGMFASFDPVALDVASADAVNAMPALPNSALSEKECCHHDHFTDLFPNTNWKSCVEHAEKLGLGRRDYELIEL